MKFILDKDKLEVQDEDEINSGSVQYYEVPVEHDTSWDDLTIEAVIAPKEGGAIIFDEAVSIAVVDGKIYIDRELSGSYAIGFKGYTIENEVKTYQISTNLRGIYFDIGAGQIIPTNNIPKPTEWEIYIAQMEAIANRAGKSAEDAEESAQTATEQAEIATEQAENAETSANTSTEQAGIATEKAETATTKAEEASQSASNAKTSEDNAKESENNASSSANSASESATSAENSANSASESASSASNSAGTASRKASEAESSASSANESATNAENSKKTAQELVAGFTSTVETATTNFNNNSTQKTNEFNQNAGNKTTEFNNNADTKTDEFNQNAEEKLEEFNENAESYNERITRLEADNESLIRTINNTTLDSTDTPSDNITLEDTGEGARLKKFVLGGKTEQDSTTGKQLLNLTEVTGASQYEEFTPTLQNGIIHAKGKNSEGYTDTSYRNGYVDLKTIDWQPSTTYYVSCKINILSNPRNVSNFLCFLNGSDSFSMRYNSTSQRYEGTITSPETITDQKKLEFRLASCELYISEVMISTDDYADWEKYTRSEYQLQIQHIHKR